jgi:SAM-dependent methyltransferase
MVQETRRRRPDARVVVGDLARLPVRDGAARVVRAERVLQWVDEPGVAVAELMRVTAPDGWLAVTDTDWGTFAVDHPDPAARARMHAAAQTWVPHARFAHELPSRLAALGAHDVRTRHDTFASSAWDPDDPGQHDGPPGLPLHSIAPHEGHAIAALAERARDGRFAASVTLVTCIARTTA